MTTTFEQRSRILADLADNNGMWCRDVTRFPDMLKGSGLPHRQITESMVGHAEGINRRLFGELVRKFVKKPEDILTVEEEHVRFDVPIEAIIRWMGSNGWEREDVKSGLSHLKVRLSARKVGKEFKKGLANQDVPEVSDEVEDKLWNVLEQG